MYFLKSRFIETKTHKKTILMQSCLQYVQWHNIEHELFLVPTTIKHRRETSSHAFYIFVQVVYTEYKAKPNFKVPHHTHKSVLLKRYLKISLRLLSSKTHSPPSGQTLSLIYLLVLRPCRIFQNAVLVAHNKCQLFGLIVKKNFFTEIIVLFIILIASYE